MTVPFSALRDSWMSDPGFRDVYARISPEMDIAFSIADARHRAKLSQKQLADAVGTSQAMVARWERGLSRPTTRSLERVAAATRSRLRIDFVANESEAAPTA